jgi:hypothetical protein
LVDREPSDPPWGIVLAPGDAGEGEGMLFPSDEPGSTEVDMGWLATKFNRLGRFTWSVCTYDEAAANIVAGTCSPPRAFSIRFRLSSLTASEARSESRRVFRRLTRASLPADGVRCRVVSRTRKSCRVSTFLGDSLIYGRVVLWNRRPPGVRTYDLTRYSARLRIYDEYCHLVNGRPRSECDEPYKSRSGWTYALYVRRGSRTASGQRVCSGALVMGRSR